MKLSRGMSNVLSVGVSSWTWSRRKPFYRLVRCPAHKTTSAGKRLQCLILSVKNEMRGAPIIVSRTHRDLVAVLFEQEVPEIYEGQVQIMAVARDPGNRAKVAVRATEEGIDAVGTCVGVKGIRVQTIVSELDDEKIDLLEWSEDPSVFIANALGARVGVRRGRTQ